MNISEFEPSIKALSSEIIISNNLNIAKYMEFEIVTEKRKFDDKEITFCKTLGSPNNFSNEGLREIKHQYQPAELQYHCGWDWLMPVVERITKERTVDKMSNRYLRTFGMLDENDKYMVRFYANRLFYGETLFDATYFAVADYCKHEVKEEVELPFP